MPKGKGDSGNNWFDKRTAKKEEKKMRVQQKLKFQSQMKEKTHHSRQSLQATEIKYEMTTSL